MYWGDKTCSIHRLYNGIQKSICLNSKKLCTTHNSANFMKIIAFLLDLIVLGGLVALMIVLVGDTYMHGSIGTKAILMGVVGGMYGLLRSIYRKWLFPEDKK